LALHGGRVRSETAKREQTAATVPQEPVNTPEALSDAQKAVWNDLAPHATKAGTLTPATATSFQRLCAAIVKHARWEAQIGTDGDTYLKVTIDGAGQEHTEVKAHPLIAKSQALDKDIRGWMKEFIISPVGKPIVQPAKAEDPFGEFMGSEAQ